MDVILFQILIAGSIFTAYILSLSSRTLKPLSLPSIITGIWVVFTVFSVFTTPLLVIQLAITAGSFYLCYKREQTKEKIASQSMEIARLKRSVQDGLSGLSPETKQSVYQEISKNSHEIVVNRGHEEQLENALDRAEYRIIITSGWVRASVVNRNFLRRLENTLHRGVHVTIGYGWKGLEPSERSQSERHAMRRLLNLKKRFERGGKGRLEILKCNNHTKILIVDKKFAVCGSHNWLSNSSLRNIEISLLTRDEIVIECLANALWEEVAAQKISAVETARH